MNFVHVNTGLTLESISSFGSSFKQMGILFGLSFLALIPTLLTKGKKIDDK